MTVGFVVTDGSESTSSSLSSSAIVVASSSTESASNPSGGNSRRTTEILESLTKNDIQFIIDEKRIADCEARFTDEVSTADTVRFHFCLLELQTAAPTRFEDVPPGIWYEMAVDVFLHTGILDATQKKFRGGDAALRAEFAKVLGKLHGDKAEEYDGAQQFDDVPRDQWYTPFVEFAGTKGWMRGYNDCIGSHPCIVMPSATITRAEAVAMIVRFFGLTATSKAPPFADVEPDAWYTTDIQAAADHCIVQGTGSSRRANPNERLNRAEMIVLLDRARQDLSYSTDCSADSTSTSSSSRMSRSVAASASSSLPPSSQVPATLSSSLSSSQAQPSSSEHSSSSLLSSSMSSSSDASVHAAAPDQASESDDSGNGGTALATLTMLIMGFVTFMIGSRFLIAAETSRL